VDKGGFSNWRVRYMMRLFVISSEFINSLAYSLIDSTEIIVTSAIFMAK
jgi:hypothetical protein